MKFLHLNTADWYETPVKFTAPCSWLDWLRHPSWLGLALLALTRAGWMELDMMTRSDDPAANVEIIVAYRNSVIRDTYSTVEEVN